MEEFLMRIGPDWRAAKSGQCFESLDPYTGENWARMPRGSADDVDAAVQVAHNAFRTGAWSTMTASAHGLLLHRLGDRIAENAERLSDLEVKDKGKLKVEMLGQMKYLRNGSTILVACRPTGRVRTIWQLPSQSLGQSIQLRFVTPDRAS
jgi:(Z)-2-((N-methylformamido)methylene)-5-hydroxybutyrolactone dehydrogenase